MMDVFPNNFVVLMVSMHLLYCQKKGEEEMNKLLNGNFETFEGQS
jgi:hypothetical protein